MTPELTDEERGLWTDRMDGHGKIKAVKKLRERTGLGLSEALALLAESTGVPLNPEQAARDAQRQTEAALREALQSAVNALAMIPFNPAKKQAAVDLAVAQAAALGIVPRSP